MLKIGLTGNYYSGQNEVSEIFEKINVKVFDADLLVKYFINYSQSHMEKIKDHFGHNAYNLGLLNLNKFKTNKNWNDLLDIVEFDIIKSYESFRLNHKEDFYTIFKYSFLFERKINTSMDNTINCYRPKHLRKMDILDLTYMDNHSVENLLNNEYDENDKNMFATYIINNYTKTQDGSIFIGLESSVENLHRIILNKKPQENISGYESQKDLWY
jgi:dephospho-CoA kinase